MNSSFKVQPTNEPADTALKQQRMEAWNPILHPAYVIAILIIAGAVFIPIGVQLIKISDNTVEMMKTYDSYYEDKIHADLDCSITEANAKKSCTIEFEVEKDMDSPVLVYYGISNFYQNHREYTTSRDDSQVSVFGIDWQVLCYYFISQYMFIIFSFFFLYSYLDH